LSEHLPPSWKRVQFDEWRLKYRQFFDRPEPSNALLERVQRLLQTGPG
jgi:hypothetical protein